MQTAPKRVNLIVYSQRFIANIYVPYGDSFTDIDGYNPLKVVQIAPKHVAVTTYVKLTCTYWKIKTYYLQLHLYMYKYKYVLVLRDLHN